MVCLVALGVMLLNGIKSDLLPVSMGIPQGLLLGPTLFILFTNDLPPSVPSGFVYIYANDNIIYCVIAFIHENVYYLRLLSNSLPEKMWLCSRHRISPL